MFNAHGQCVEQQAADTADLWFDPNANNTQPSDAASQQMQAQYAEQEAATEAAAGDNWEYTGVNDNYQFYTQWTTIEPTLGWPGNAASAMATFVSATYASISDALDGFAVLDSACSHRSVFNNIKAFPNGVTSDSNVIMVDSNGQRTAAPGIGSASFTAFPVGAKPLDVTFSEAVYNPKCPVNLICVSNILKNKDKTLKDNDVSFKLLKIDLNVNNPATHRTIPIEELNGLFVIKMAFIAALTTPSSNSE